MLRLRGRGEGAEEIRLMDDGQEWNSLFESEDCFALYISPHPSTLHVSGNLLTVKPSQYHPRMTIQIHLPLRTHAKRFSPATSESELVSNQNPRALSDPVN